MIDRSQAHATRSDLCGGLVRLCLVASVLWSAAWGVIAWDAHQKAESAQALVEYHDESMTGAGYSTEAKLADEAWLDAVQARDAQHDRKQLATWAALLGPLGLVVLCGSAYWVILGFRPV